MSSNDEEADWSSWLSSSAELVSPGCRWPAAGANWLLLTSRAPEILTSYNQNSSEARIDSDQSVKELRLGFDWFGWFVLYCIEFSVCQCVVFNGIACYCIVLHCFVWCCKVLHGIAWYCVVMNGTTQYFKVLHDNAWYCMPLHDIEWFCN